jgi:hypothetical protein
VQHPLIDGEGLRNAYVNRLVVDGEGGWHISWTWRETWDVATNHDILYARSADEGETWMDATGARLTLPVTVSADPAFFLPQGRGLINQTTMTVGARGRPLIATYWTPDGMDTPQYHLVWFDGARWRSAPIGRRTTPFTLEGGGTRRIPLSRPLVLLDSRDGVYVVFRDFERGDGIFVAVSTDADREHWEIAELYRPTVGLWEPVHDPAVWREHGLLHLLVQQVGQGDAETMEDLPPQPIGVLEWDPCSAFPCRDTGLPSRR